MHRRPDLRLADIRGNVETRLRKLVEQELDALILAEAGLGRLGLAREITEILDRVWMLPAVGQGIVAVECAAQDWQTRRILSAIDDAPAHLCADAEREVLWVLNGHCNSPVAGYATIAGKLEERYHALLQRDPQLESRPTFLFFKGAANGLFAEGAKSLLRGVNDRQALKIGIKCERGSHRFFKKYGERFEDSEGKQIFLEFADEERNHLDLLIREYNALSKRQARAPRRTAGARARAARQVKGARSARQTRASARTAKVGSGSMLTSQKVRSATA